MHSWHTLQYTLLRGLARLLAAQGIAGVRSVATRMGGLMWHLVPSRRKLAIDTIAARLQLPVPEATALARSSFSHNVQSFLEMTLAPGFTLERPELRVSDPALFARVRACGRPMVCAGAHLGAWELGAGLAGAFLPGALEGLIVARTHPNPGIQKFIESMRGHTGSLLTGHRNASKAVLKTLRNKGIAAFLVDHNCSQDEALFLPFLGKVAAVNIGPAVLGVRAGALIWPLFVVREGDGYVLLVEEPLDTLTLTGTTQERIAKAATFYTEAVERRVRQYPEQWFWMHKRWKTRPPDAAVPSASTIL